MINRILVATDDSELSQKAVQGAIDLALVTKAKLFALHVVPRYPTSYFEGGMAQHPNEVARIEKKWSDKAHVMVDAAAAKAREAGVDARGVVAHSDSAAEAIIAAADKHECDLIVMASHGRRGIQRVLLGSETQHVLTHTTTPVLVLR